MLKKHPKEIIHVELAQVLFPWNTAKDLAECVSFCPSALDLWQQGPEYITDLVYESVDIPRMN